MERVASNEPALAPFGLQPIDMVAEPIEMIAEPIDGTSEPIELVAEPVDMNGG